MRHAAGASGAFDEVSSFEAGSGTGEGDEVGCVDGPPPLLGGLGELQGHGEGGGRGADARRCDRRMSVTKNLIASPASLLSSSCLPPGRVVNGLKG